LGWGCALWAVSRSFSRGDRFHYRKKNNHLFQSFRGEWWSFATWFSFLVLVVSWCTFLSLVSAFILRFCHSSYCEHERVYTRDLLWRLRWFVLFHYFWGPVLNLLFILLYYNITGRASATGVPSRGGPC
jgi:hypothetical protein